MLDESACFFDPEDVAIISSSTVPGPKGSCRGRVCVGINVSRVIGTTPEKRLQAFLEAAEQKFTRDDLEAAANLAATKGGVPATALTYAGAIHGDVPVTSAVPGLGGGAVGPARSEAAPIFRGVDPAKLANPH